ncbi:MAG TPA: hypothetical protein VFP42_09945 [Acidimicrobiia bacterium]|nr:hypothetical protein [Acidimicrobiia bacterium]
MPFDALDRVAGISGIVEMDRDVRYMIRDSFAGLGPLAMPFRMPQLPETCRIEWILRSDVALDQ